MSKIDVLIIVHNEQEGLLSVGNSERARDGYWATGKSGCVRTYSRLPRGRHGVLRGHKQYFITNYFKYTILIHS